MSRKRSRTTRSEKSRQKPKSENPRERKPEPYRCNSCNWDFRTREELEGHNREHRDIRNGIVIKCLNCKSPFTTEAEMENHLRANHREISFRPREDDQDYRERREIMEDYKSPKPAGVP